MCKPTIVLALVALASPATAVASPQPPVRAQPQPKDSLIPYYNAAPGSAAVVRRAVDAWNGAGAGVRFVAIPRAQAQVIIRAAPRRYGCSGLATIQHRPPPENEDAAITYGFPSTGQVRLGEGCPVAVVRAVVAAHELGHIVGLVHQRRGCSIMSPTADVVNGTLRRFPGCSRNAWASLTRRLLTPADVDNTRNLYRTGIISTPRLGSQDANRALLGPAGWGAILLAGIATVAGVGALLRR